MVTQHPTIDKQPLNVTLVSAELVTTHGTVPPRHELWLTLANEGVAATHFTLKMLVNQVRTEAV